MALSDMEVTLKDLVKMRVLGHLNAGARDSVLARDATRFCNQISAQIKGVSESKEIQNRGYQASNCSNEVKVRISLVIMKELMEEGHVVNRHISLLFNENQISTFEDLEIKNLTFIKSERGP